MTPSPLALAPALGLAAAVACQWGLAGRPRPDPNHPLYVPSPRIAPHVASGLRVAWADWLYIRGLLYVHHEIDNPRKSYRALPAIYEATTELDPKFLEAYLYGAWFLTMLRKDDEGAIRLLEKGARRLPDRWELWNEIGMVHMLGRKDRAAALEALKRAAGCPECPPFVARYVAFVSKGTEHDLDVLRILEERYRNAPTELRPHLEGLWKEHAARLAVARIEREGSGVRAATGAFPATLDAILPRAFADLPDRRPPVAAGTLLYDPATGKVRSLLLEERAVAEGLRQAREVVGNFREARGRWPADLSEPAREGFPRVPAPPAGGRWAYDPATGAVGHEAAPAPR
ncbi:MAG: hypothetical protein L0216_17950 [Planctomycetales bacterium]|nr:hypothetical protein [Planctomycetales bacterium]